MPIRGPLQALAFNNFSRLSFLDPGTNSVYGYPSGLPTGEPRPEILDPKTKAQASRHSVFISSL